MDRHIDALRGFINQYIDVLRELADRYTERHAGRHAGRKGALIDSFIYDTLKFRAASPY